MNRYLTRTSIAMLVFTTILALIGCGREEPNTNQIGNSAVVNKSNASESNTSIMVAESECDIKNIQDRRNEVHKKIESKVKGKAGEKGLKVQYEKGGFELITEINDPSDPKSYLVVYVFGMIQGTDELEEFANLINDFNKKDGCVSRVVFLPKESLQRKTFRTDPAFEWTYCPYDIQPCSDGSCGCRFTSNQKSSENGASNSIQPRNNNSAANSSSSSSP